MIAGSITVRDQTFFVPTRDQLPASIMLHYISGNVFGMFKSILGEEQFDRLMDLDPTMGELEDMTVQISKLFDVEGNDEV